MGGFVKNNFKVIERAFSNIHVSNELEEKILNRTIHKRKIIVYKYVVSSMIIFIMIVSGIGIWEHYKLGSKEAINGKDNNVNVNKDIDPNIDMYMNISRELSWAYNVSDTQLIANNSDYIVKVKVLNIGDGTYEYSPNSNPTTPIKVEILSILKGDKNVQISQILKWGGYVTIEEFINNNPAEQIEKMGLNKLSKLEQQSKYIQYEEMGNYDFQVGNTYVIALRENKNGNFFIVANGYGIFEEDEISKKYINVLTKKDLNI